MYAFFTVYKLYLHKVKKESQASWEGMHTWNCCVLCLSTGHLGPLEESVHGSVLVGLCLLACSVFNALFTLILCLWARACICACVLYVAWYPKRWGEADDLLGRSDSEPPCGLWELNLGPLDERSVLLAVTLLSNPQRRTFGAGFFLPPHGFQRLNPGPQGMVTSTVPCWAILPDSQSHFTLNHSLLFPTVFLSYFPLLLLKTGIQLHVCFLIDCNLCIAKLFIFTYWMYNPSSYWNP